MKHQTQQTPLTFPVLLARLTFLTFFNQKNGTNEAKNKTNPTINDISGGRVVVTKDVPDFALGVGNSVKGVSRMSEADRKLKFDEEGCAFCEKSQKQYKLENGYVY